MQSRRRGRPPKRRAPSGRFDGLCLDLFLQRQMHIVFASASAFGFVFGIVFGSIGIRSYLFALFLRLWYAEAKEREL